MRGANEQSPAVRQVRLGEVRTPMLGPEPMRSNRRWIDRSLDIVRQRGNAIGGRLAQPTMKS
jgi:hypothetical protein